jgi:hypothetical protein
MKKTNITLSIALAAVFSASTASTAFAAAEVTGKIVHESAAFTESGIGIGAATTTTQTANSHGKDVMKTETSARIFIDGDAEELHEGSTYHVELNLMHDSKGVGKYDKNESYTQRDALREAYVDAEVSDFSLRVGKQQVVWGTADGMKLLDAINPTDYAEMAQNQMEDSRIPVWMINAESASPYADGGNFQFIISEGKSSNFAGMGNSSSNATSHTNGDQGHAFIMKGADTITGKVHGILNVAPALGKTAAIFDAVATDGFSMPGLTGQGGSRVLDFVNGEATGFQAVCTDGTQANENASCLANVAHNAKLDRGAAINGYTSFDGASIQEAQNVLDKGTANSAWDITNANSMFEYMSQASFKTFDAFVDMTSSYVVDHSDTPTVALRYQNATPDGLNYSFNAIKGNDTNPYVLMSWEKADGTPLYENLVNVAGSFNGGVNVASVILSTNNTGAVTNEVGGNLTTGSTTLASERANLKMTEKLNQIVQIGGSFDTAIETAKFGPVVLRGEALYQKDVMSPVITRKDSTGRDLDHGFMVSSIKMEKGDRFKYVLGADITALTNMMVSVQFIQDMNLDFYDVGNQSATNWKYTADMATMHMTNNLNKGEKNKEFYSLFLSKPFGASGEHRWNNIFMFEENGGKWNRLDAEFSINDDTQATVEFNKYFGDENTQFGQLAKSSNIQVGVKYSF